MAEDATAKSSKRRYHAPIRQAQAELTRRRILDAAAAVFKEKGYGATSMEGIAARAGVSVPTLYGTFGGKPQILSALILGLKEETNVHAAVSRLMAGSDPAGLLRQGVAVAAGFNAVAWELLDVLRDGARSQGELASLWDEVEGARFRDQETIAQRFAEEGVLREGVSVPQAAAIFWTLTAHDQYRLLVVECGWNPAAAERWLAGTLCEALLRTASSS